MATVLVVDDNVINRILLNEIIENLGYSYEEADSGRAALEMMREKDYNAVLLDVEMPKMNGFEVVKEVRNQLPAPKHKTLLIAITAHDPVTFKEEYENSGFDELIAKPYSQDKIEEVFRNLKVG